MQEGHLYNNLLTSLFIHHDEAGRAYNAALKLGYQQEEINVLMSKETKEKHGYERKHPEINIEDEAIKGAGVGGSLGVTIGAIIGVFIAIIAFITMSGIGIKISEAVAVCIAGSVAGGIAGGLVGALINMSISANHPENFKKELENGAILVILTPHSEIDRKNLEIEWHKYNGIILRA